MNRRQFFHDATGALIALTVTGERTLAGGQSGTPKTGQQPSKPKTSSTGKASATASGKSTAKPASKAVGKIWMVVVGVNNYNAPGIPKLPSPALDVLNVKNSFEGTNAELDIMVNGNTEGTFRPPTKQNIEQAIQRIVTKVGPNDTLWFYFSGHGVSLNGRSYLVPEDAKPGNDFIKTLVSVSDIRARMQKVQARSRVLVLDSCQSGATKSLLKSSAGWESILGSVSGIVTMAACQIDQSAIDTGTGSLFTNYLLQGILGRAADNSKSITISHLEHFVKEGVNTYSLGKQTPVFLYKSDADAPVAAPNPSALDRLPSLENQTQFVRQPLKPGLIVLIQEEHADAAGNLTRETLLQPILQSQFIKDGFPVLVEEEMRNFRIRLNDPNQANVKAAVGNLNCRFLLRGSAKIKPVPKRFAEQADFETVQAEVKVQLIDTLGNDLGTVVTLETGRGVSDASAIKMAMDRAANKIHAELIDKLKSLLPTL